MRSIALLPLLLFFAADASAQIAGNQVYGNSSSQNSWKSILQSGSPNVQLSDSTLLLTATVVSYHRADRYVAVLGLREEGPTVADCNRNIQERLDRLQSALQKSGIDRNDLFVDIVGQVRMYDWREVNGKPWDMEEYATGFQISRNLIVRYRDKEDIEKILALAAEYQVYDLIKVDYVVEDEEAVYDELFEAALEVIGKKKQRYLAATGMKLLPVSRIYGERMLQVQPKDLYLKYQAASGSKVDSDYYNRKTRLFAPKFETFYYDGLELPDMDRVLHGDLLEPSPAFVLKLQILYEIDRG